MINISKIVNIYTQSLLDVAVEKNQLDDVYNSFRSFHDLIQASDNLKKAFSLETDLILKPHLYEEIVVIFHQNTSCPIIFVNFLKALISNKRIKLFETMFQTFSDFYFEKKNFQKVELISSYPLEKETSNNIKTRLEEKLSKTIILSEKCDPSILGGYIVKIGEKLYDNSIKSRLDQLKETLSKGV